jgi:hypothetical protein
MVQRRLGRPVILLPSNSALSEMVEVYIVRGIGSVEPRWELLGILGKDYRHFRDSLQTAASFQTW